MFFQGTLQEGIASAVQHQKRVICFVRDDGNVSSEWEQDYLLPLSGALTDHAVVLKLVLGSVEAGYLSAICPVDTAPTVVVISSGQVAGVLHAPMSVEDFRKQVLTVMGLLHSTISRPEDGSATASSPQDDAGANASDIAPAVNQPAAASANAHPRPGVNSRNAAGPSSSAADPSGAAAAAANRTSAISSLLAERRQRMAEREAEEARQRQEQVEARRQAAQVPDSRAAYQAKIAEDRRKQKQKAADEKQRVLDLIEADRKERKRLEQQRREQRDAEKAVTWEGGNSAKIPNVQVVSVVGDKGKGKARDIGAAGQCRLQLRFWDGRVERTDFSAAQTLGQTKEWIEKNIEPRAGPYSLREVVGFGAARQFDLSDEKETLSSLGLTPSATLVVKPVAGTSAEAKRNGVRGIMPLPYTMLMKVWTLIVTLLMPLWTVIEGFVRADHRHAAPESRAGMDHDDVGRTSGTQAGGGKVQTIEDRKKKRDRLDFYNGNTTNVVSNQNTDDEDALD